MCDVQLLFKAMLPLLEQDKPGNWSPEYLEDYLPTGRVKPYIPTTSFWF